MATTIVKTVGLTKTYESNGNAVRAVKNVNLEIMKGELVAIMGPSGSGKTTLLTLLGCLDRPTQGRVLLGTNSLNVTALPETSLCVIRRKQLGFVFQNFNLIPNLTAIENVELPMEGLIPSAKRRRKRARILLRMLEIPDREKHRPAQLSAGQQQRVAIARALANGPALILADEPTGNLDYETSLSIMSILQRLSAEQKRTIVMVTHDPLMATFATRKLVLRDGRLSKEDFSSYADLTRFATQNGVIDQDSDDADEPTQD